MAELFAGTVLKGTILLIVIFGIAFLTRRASAAVRHLVWSAGLVGLLVLPLLSALVPWRLDVLPLRVAAIGETNSGPAMNDRPESAAVPSSGVRTAKSGPLTSKAAPLLSHARSSDGNKAVVDPTPAGFRPVGPGLTGQPPAVAPSSAWTPIRMAIMAWAIGALLVLGWILFGIMSVTWVARRAAPLTDAEWYEALGWVVERLGLRTTVRLLRSGAAPMPITCGFLRPSVVLPVEADGWPEDRRRSVLLHELAHVQRLDLIVHLLAWIACAVYWFHPLVWIAARRLRHESERACDDLVLGAGTRPSTYAGHLLDIVRASDRARSPAGAVPMAQRSLFEGRLLAILEPGVERRRVTASHATAVVALVAACAVPLAAMAPAAPDAATGAGGSVGQAALNDAGPSNRGPLGWWAAQTAGLRWLAQLGELGELGKLGKLGQMGDLGKLGELRKLGELGEVGNLDELGKLSEFAGMTLLRQDPTDTQSQVAAADPRTLSALEAALGDPSPAVRMAAAQSLGDIQDPRAVEALSRVLREDENAGVRRMAAWALGEIEDERAVPALVSGLQDEDPGVREMAAWALGEIESPTGVAALGEALRDGSPEVRLMAVWALGEITPERAPQGLIEALADEGVEVRRTAAWALGEIGDPAAIPALRARLQDPDGEVKKAAVWALTEIDDPLAAEALIELLQDADPEVREAAAHALGEMN